MHVDEQVIESVRARFGRPVELTWEGEISEREWGVATYNPQRVHDVTVFILHGERIALIRKHHFPHDVWRPPGGGVKPGEDFAAAVVREALEETGLAVDPVRYLVTAHALFTHEARRLAWTTHVLSATTGGGEPAPLDTDEIAEARWGTLDELAGPLRETLLATGRAFWRYRVALHDAALEALRRG